MGCFSYKCKKSGKAVLSSSFQGSAVHLFLLKDGKVIEKMHGNYDSYGRVFSDVKKDDDDSHTKFTSFKWGMPWGDVCMLESKYDKSNGIAAILATEWKEGDPYPTERSENDPNQGWGEDWEHMGSGSDYIIDEWVENPTHEIFN